MNQRDIHRVKAELPHLFGYPHYPWSKKFFESTNRWNFLVAANQIGKSTSQIRKAIDWATDKKKWKTLWATKPQQFWYFYPAKAVCTSEFETKWIPEFLPRGDMKENSIYGWEAKYRGKEVDCVKFKSGVTIYFKSYEQDAQNLQTASVHAIFNDEEAPFSLFQELRSRLVATNGYFHMVFTATLGQEEWRRTIEPSNKTEELFKEALKIQVSMYDCLKYADGSASPWTVERIKEVESQCATDAEIQRRVHGRFVVSAGLKYVSFDRGRNVIPSKDIPEDWLIYTGTDLGSGGEHNHPSAIVFIAVQPDFKKGIVFHGWRGDGVVTTSTDVLQKHNEMCVYGDRLLHPVIKAYDWHNRDFFNIATRSGSGFTPADKRRDHGENLLNTLFKTSILVIFGDDPELSKLVVELSSLMNSKAKTSAKDDFIDALRYAASSIPWDFSDVKMEAGIKIEEVDKYVETRSRGEQWWQERKSGSTPKTEKGEAEEELDYWQSLLE